MGGGTDPSGAGGAHALGEAPRLPACPPQRKTRYRKARFLNRRRRDGWLPPSLESRLANVLCWVSRLQRLCPLGALSQELVRFDTQLLQNPEIRASSTNRATWPGYEVREYILEKFGRQCVYCKQDQRALGAGSFAAPLAGWLRSGRVILPRRVVPVTRRKGTRLPRSSAILRWRRRRRHHCGMLPRSTYALGALSPAGGARSAGRDGNGGRTKWNRHSGACPRPIGWMRSVSAPRTPEQIRWQSVVPLEITALGRHNRQMVHVTGGVSPWATQGHQCGGGLPVGRSGASGSARAA